jgi:anti-sigma regulatory factor (Ser/Thr protein kinase)
VDKSGDSVGLFRREAHVRSFFDTAAVPGPRLGIPQAEVFGRDPDSDAVASRSAHARIAVYDSLTAAPRVEDVASADPASFIEQLSARTYQCAHDQGGRLPYTLIREIVENFIHARFTEVVVTIMECGNTVRFSDQGPGIPEKEKAFQPGFSTASSEMKRVIRGVGSGLPIVKECLSFSAGTIVVDDNLGTGTVVTLHVDPPETPAPESTEVPVDVATGPRLSVRQKQVLSLILELGAVGPSAVSRELSVGLSTAFRDLAFLEHCGLIVTDPTGKRVLTEDGIAFLDTLFHP